VAEVPHRLQLRHRLLVQAQGRGVARVAVRRRVAALQQRGLLQLRLRVAEHQRHLPDQPTRT
jgi:hypothetical protein